MLNLILFGPPGCGKGTQAIKLAEEFQLLHISTGDLLRNEVKTETPLGVEAKKFMDKGEYVPDEVMIGMISNKIDEFAGKVKGIIFDGFPRTTPQAEALDKLLEFKNTSIKKVIALEVEEEEIVERILLRGKTSGRSDDNDEATIRKRFNIYQKETAPVAALYAAKDLFTSVKGIGEIDEIFELLKAEIEQLGA
ncbi:MAG: adenylate kinase [Bacteroidetes bacterium]|jgi:adenylate kinase|nr:adenylate kinase [Bacteroidota bacterium]MBK7138286.1 adenylate kinase [Bacteroidota bacterium]MBK7505435.1 adenylate kinase [Bacteroidota bacterium]MBK7639301.1 adenylate kinase [Bacteroidota bacterium]MBK8674483.1 adenylate kinase [Bacteroidota bacterium]